VNTIARWLSKLGGKSRLKSFAAEQARVGAVVCNQRGLQIVPTDRIVGSVGRADDFDSGFRPKRLAGRRRVRGLRLLFEHELSLPPIQLYQIGEEYYVLDGHHRVAAARQIGRQFVDAEVVECPLPARG
jgi:hypothetical protein